MTFNLSLVMPLQSLLEQAGLRVGKFWSIDLVAALMWDSVGAMWDSEEAGADIEIDVLRGVVENLGGILSVAVRHSGPAVDIVWAGGTKTAGTGCTVRALNEFLWAVSQELILEVTIPDERLAAIKRKIERNE